VCTGHLIKVTPLINLTPFDGTPRHALNPSAMQHRRPHHLRKSVLRRRHYWYNSQHQTRIIAATNQLCKHKKNGALFCLFVCSLDLFTYFFHYSFFQAIGWKRWANLALVFCVYFVLLYILLLMHVCFCCVWFTFSVLSQEVGWVERLQNDLFCVGWNIKP